MTRDELELALLSTRTWNLVALVEVLKFQIMPLCSESMHIFRDPGSPNVDGEWRWIR